MTSMITTSTVWKAGKNTYVVTVPKVIRDALNIEEGDLVETTFKLIKKNNKKENTEKIVKETSPDVNPPKQGGGLKFNTT